MSAAMIARWSPRRRRTSGRSTVWIRSPSRHQARRPRASGSALSQIGVRTKAIAAAPAAARTGPRKAGAATGRVSGRRVVAGERVDNQRGIGERAREDADMVELAREQQNARAARSGRARLACRIRRKRMPDGSPSRWSASRSRAAPCRPRPPRPSRRGAARRAFRICGLRVGPGMEIGELGGHRLADDDRAGCAQPRHRRAVAHRLATEQRRAAFGRVVGGVEDVLDADRNAMQRADRMAVAAALVERARLRQRISDRDARKRLLVFDRGNAVEAGAGIPPRIVASAILRPASIADSVSDCHVQHQFRRACGAARARIRKDVDQRHRQEHHEHEGQRAAEDLREPHLRRRHPLR